MKERYEFVAPCHFGLEAVTKREIGDLGYEVIRVEDGKVTFAGDLDALARANIFLRTTQRILWKVAEFRAVTFEELFQGIKNVPWEEFQGIKNVPWEEYFPKDARFWVTKATSVKSALFSPSDIQSIAKKAMVERMKEHYHISWFAETGQEYPVRISIYKDMVTVGLDTSGESLHKRGYRKMVSKAVEEGPDSGRSVLWQRYISYRGGYDGSQHRAGNAAEFPGTAVDEPDSGARLAESLRGGGRSGGHQRGYGYPGL